MSIYDAFQKEAENRRERSIEEWQAAEREAVMREAAIQAARFGFRTPTLKEVERAEIYACGSVDYGAKWAYRLVDIMRSGEKP